MIQNSNLTPNYGAEAGEQSLPSEQTPGDELKGTRQTTVLVHERMFLLPDFFVIDVAMKVTRCEVLTRNFFQQIGLS
jgi:hypothetical protein